eukprot:TRINITY_DN7454_c0_g1_i5.p1 TRINITY_DN7454_c0_g1~~TRINITY_DN7454_c0_g1_i5.p1  ORF type:complete len:793 (+),score=162.43 TRINITY_DN7454_c0_g1_i5:88-2466(+)
MAQSAPSFRIFVDGCDTYYGRFIVSTFRKEGHTVIGVPSDPSLAIPKSARKGESDSNRDGDGFATAEDETGELTKRSLTTKDLIPPKSPMPIGTAPTPLIRMSLASNAGRKTEINSARPGSRNIPPTKPSPGKIQTQGSGDLSDAVDMTPHEYLPKGNALQYASVLATCDVVVLSLLENASRAADIFSVLEKCELTNSCHTIVLSSFMTWAKTPVDTDSGSDPITESEFRRRQPHSGFKWQYDGEKVFSRNKNKNIKVNVLTCGLLYGCGEEVLQGFFKESWTHGRVTCIGGGTNKFPTIHVRDLATIVNEVVKRKPMDPYIFACDESADTFKDKLMALASATQAKVEEIAFEDAIMLSDWHLQDLDRVHLNVDHMSLIVPEWDMKWRYKKGFSTQVIQVIQEFKMVHGVSPLKIMIRGPPSSGKSLLGNQLSQFYGIPHLHIAGVISSILESDCDIAVEAKKYLEELSHKPVSGKHAPPSNRLPDDILVKIYKERMKWRDCALYGFVLDGFPKTIAQANSLFTDSSISEEGPKPVEIHTENPSRVPSHVILLDATIEKLKEFLPSTEGWGTPAPSHSNDEGLARRMAAYQQTVPDKVNPMAYFNDKDLPIVNVDAFQDMSRVITSLSGLIGPKRGFSSPSPPMTMSLLHTQADEADDITIEGPLTRQSSRPTARMNEGSITSRSEKSPLPASQSAAQLATAGEDELLKSLAVPLQQYLIETVLPVVADALVYISQERPEYPVRTLADMIMRARRRRERERKFHQRHEKDMTTLKFVHSFNSQNTRRHLMGS